MTSFSEKAGRVYGSERKKVESTSWIPKRASGGLLAQFKKEHLDEKGLSQVRAEEILANQLKPGEIFGLVEEMLEILLHTDEIEIQLANFHESFGKFYEKYESLLIQALEEFIEEKVNFLVYSGHIDKEILKAKVKEIEGRKRRLKRETNEPNH